MPTFANWFSIYVEVQTTKGIAVQCQARLFSFLTEQLVTNKLALIVDPCNTIQDEQLTARHSVLDIKESIQKKLNTKFLGLQIVNQEKWKNNINQMIPKCRKLCSQVSIPHQQYKHSDQFILNIFNSTTKFGIIFWGEGYTSNSGKIFVTENHQKNGS